MIFNVTPKALRLKCMNSNQSHNQKGKKIYNIIYNGNTLPVSITLNKLYNE